MNKKTLVVVTATWVLLRIVFFEGFVGTDDFQHLRYALCWDRVPQNHWEARVLYNGLLRVLFSLFGFNAFSASIPNLLGSLATLFCGMYWASRLWGTGRAIALTGLILATLPADVRLSTEIRCYSLPVGLLSIGMTGLFHGRREVSHIVSSVAFSLAASLHIVNIIFIGILFLALLLVEPNRFKRWVSVGVLITMFFLLTEFLTFYFWTGDPLYQFHISQKTHFAKDLVRFGSSPFDSVFHENGRLNPGFFYWPVTTVCASKLFGFTLIFALMTSVVSFRGLGHILKIFSITTILFWVWVSYGSQSPTRYLPYWRLERFWYPLALPVALLAVHGVTTIHGKLAKKFLPILLLSTNLLLLCMKGEFGSQAKIAQELLDYVRSHPGVYVAAGATLDDLYLLNGCHPLPDLFRPPGSPPPQFSACRTLPEELLPSGSVNVLVNPAHADPVGPYSLWVGEHTGETVYSSPVQYRAVFELLPPHWKKDWMIVKKSGLVVRAK